MCLAVPGKVVSIDRDAASISMAKVSFSGVIKDICIEWLPEVEVGDYVLAHAGTALNKVDSAEAEETLKVFDQWVIGLDKEDEEVKPA
jgi:hydrogenase expression/formation protein HypC